MYVESLSRWKTKCCTNEECFFPDICPAEYSRENDKSVMETIALTMTGHTWIRCLGTADHRSSPSIVFPNPLSALPLVIDHRIQMSEFSTAIRLSADTGYDEDTTRRIIVVIFIEAYNAPHPITGFDCCHLDAVDWTSIINVAIAADRKSSLYRPRQYADAPSDGGVTAASADEFRRRRIACVGQSKVCLLSSCEKRYIYIYIYIIYTIVATTDP